MGIPESQLITWSKQGAITTAKNSHEVVERALRRHGPSVDYEVYLQGSYKNSTNIDGDSDVDVVAQLNSTFYPDLSLLDLGQRAAFQRRYPGSAGYTWEHFRRDVLAALRQGFGYNSVKEGNKCLTVAGGNGRLPCDVVPCLEYRLYRSYTGIGPGSWIPGIAFWARDGRQIVNFPKPHYENGVAKQKSTSEWFKPVVRVFKNARNAAVRRRYLVEDTAPSYFLEGFVHSVPHGQFGQSYASSFCSIVDWWSRADLPQLFCQNGVTRLFGGTPEQWSETSAKQFIGAVASVWNNWY